ncbi:unnamed protein product (macronuclear) [Paramecium tetraurelia]|uniref:Uncharacterized protein n=1 Tax=Paramecium tetraurelia TaxID=5888 RepID=A0DPQ1_PARTE|nr:uncharacterized protein GSPATT00019200001 [Paramecium tetraurelia]CAK85018.1 unnamed protein product [Paramecium tetraurelia]|eukprot:XP_001452415.1 hypothetical protein (macronuclear) [Paramecium tetraurelia strain d4-2]
MQNFEDETFVRQLISDITRPIADKLEKIQKEFENIRLSIHKHSRMIDIMSDKSDQLSFDIKLTNDTIENLRKNIKEDQQKVFEIENHFNLDFNNTRLEQGVITQEQDNLKKEIKILGDVQQSLTERVEIYNNYLSQKLYQQEFTISNVDTSNSKVIKEITNLNLKNQEELQAQKIQTQDILAKMQKNSQDLNKTLCSQQWMQDMIVELRQKSQFYLTIDQVDSQQKQQTPQNNTPPVITQSCQISNQVDQQDFSEIIAEKLNKLKNQINTEMQQQKEQNSFQIEELKKALNTFKSDFVRRLQLIQSNLKDTNDKLLISVGEVQEQKLSLKQQISQINELLQRQFSKISQDIQTIQTNITGLDLRMAETHSTVIHVQDKQKEAFVNQTPLEYFNNQNDIISLLPIKQESQFYDSFQFNNTVTQKFIKTDQTLQFQPQQLNSVKKQREIQFVEPEQTQTVTENLENQNNLITPQRKVQNEIIKLKSDFFNEQQYNQNQMNKLLKQKTITEQALQDVDKQLKQFHSYFGVIFSLILHNELTGTDYQAKIVGNGFKFEFLPFQQDEKTMMLYQNNKISKVDLLMKTIICTNSMIAKQKQNGLQFQQEKQKQNTEIIRELQTMYINKKNRLIDDKYQTERLNLSLDTPAYQQTPKQKVTKVLVKYKKLLD